VIYLLDTCVLVWQALVTYVVEARSHSIRFILQEVTSDGFVADAARSGGVRTERSGFRRRREEGRGHDERQAVVQHLALVSFESEGS
jgi:hypothetical protein